MDIKKPIFIFGVGRSGTTAFHRSLANHEDVAWLSGLCGRHPNMPSRNKYIMRAIDYPLVGKYVKKRIQPWENYPFWEYYCKGFSTPCRDLISSDVTQSAKYKIRNALSQVMTEKRNRLLIKITGWPRIGYLYEIFNDAKFIHLVRDGRAVVNSRVNQDFWTGYGGPSKWTHGDLTQGQSEEWEKSNRSFITLGSIEWKLLIDAAEQAKKTINMNNYLEVKYEDFCANPVDVLRKVLNHCELEWSADFEQAIRNSRIRNENDKWERELTVAQQNELNRSLKDYLMKYGYR